MAVVTLDILSGAEVLDEGGRPDPDGAAYEG